MSTDLDPIVSNWYRHLDKGQAFRVVAVDADAGSVDIQDFDGNLDTIDLDNWYELDIESVEPPENWARSTSPRPTISAPASPTPPPPTGARRRRNCDTPASAIR